MEAKPAIQRKVGAHTSFIQNNSYLCGLILN